MLISAVLDMKQRNRREGMGGKGSEREEGKDYSEYSILYFNFIVKNKWN